MGPDDIQILRVNGEGDDFIIMACLSRLPVSNLSIKWPKGPSYPSDSPSVMCDCTDVVQIQNAETLFAMSAWIASAATWLKEQQARDTEVD
jgi:hypothetical protein